MKTFAFFTIVAFCTRIVFGAIETVDGVTYTYSIKNNAATIEKCVDSGVSYTPNYYPAISTSTSGELVIPSMLGGYPVKVIGFAAFRGCELLTSIVIPEDVTSIGYESFKGCISLTSIIIPQRVTRVNYGAFFGCSSLTSVVIPSSVVYVGEDAFSQTPFYDQLSDNSIVFGGVFYKQADKTITEIVVPDTVVTIGIKAFSDCKSLMSISIPESVKTIEQSAFINCSSITKVNVPKCVTKMSETFPAAYTNLKEVVLAGEATNVGDSMFSGCNSLTSVIMPNGMKEIGKAAFSGCSSLEFVTIPNSVTNIGERAFYECSAMRSIEIPNGVTSLRPRIFSGCSILSSIAMPNSVESVEEYAFLNCNNLRSVSYDGPLVDWLKMSFGNREANPMSQGAVVTATDGEISGSLTIPEGVEEIKDYAFIGNERMTKVHIPTSVTSIATTAFVDVNNIARVTIPACVKVLSETFPASYNKIEEVYIHDGVTEIAANAFAGCASLRKIRIPDSVTTIGANAFSGCAAIEEIEVPFWVNSASVFSEAKANIKKVKLIGEKGVMPDKAYSGFESLNDVIIEDGVTAIGGYAFQNCKNLTEIDIPQSVTSMGSYVFSGCSALIDVELKGDAPDVGYGLFDGTPKRMIVSVPNNSIGWNGSVSTNLPEIWGGRLITHSSETILWPGSNDGPTVCKYVTVTNVVVHYVLNSVQPEFAKPVSKDTGFVNVIAEVKGNNVAVPQTWADNYPGFAAKFGSDFTKALTAKSGKIAAGGREMLVWEDYVAGTDPTDPNDKFTASVTIVNGKPVVSYTPELDDARKALRKYTTYGKIKLTDNEWTVVPEGEEAAYNFFKVTVEMK